MKNLKDMAVKPALMIIAESGRKEKIDPEVI